MPRDIARLGFIRSIRSNGGIGSCNGKAGCDGTSWIFADSSGAARSWCDAAPLCGKEPPHERRPPPPSILLGQHNGEDSARCPGRVGGVFGASEPYLPAARVDRLRVVETACKTTLSALLFIRSGSRVGLTLRIERRVDMASSPRKKWLSAALEYIPPGSSCNFAPPGNRAARSRSTSCASSRSAARRRERCAAGPDAGGVEGGPGDYIPLGDKVILANPQAWNPFLNATEIEVTGRDKGRVSLDNGYGNHGEPIVRRRNKVAKVVEIDFAGCKLLAESALAQEMRARYRLVGCDRESSRSPRKGRRPAR